MSYVIVKKTFLKCTTAYRRKYWRSLNLAVWSQAVEIKILADLNLAVALRSVIRHYKHCERVYQGALPSSCLRYLNKAISSQNITGSMLTTS